MPRRRIHDLLDRLAPVDGVLDGKPLVFQERDSDLAVQIVVVDQKDAALLQVVPCVGVRSLRLMRCRRPFAGQLQGQLDGEGGALALDALHGDGAVHHVDEVLGDGHAQAGSLDAADGGGALAFERVEDVLDELRAHADARVRHDEPVAPVARRRAIELVDLHLHEAAGVRELQGVAEQVQQDLVDAQLVAAHVGMAHPGGVHGEVQLAGARFGLDDAVEVLQEVDQVVGLLVEGHLAALDVAHVQDVVDETEEVGAGGLDLAQVLLNPLGLVDAAGGQGGEAHDGVHGRADVVGHVGEEGALGGIRLVGLGEGLFQKGPLLHLFAGLDIDAAQAEDDVVSHAPIAVAHDGGLVVLGVLAAADAVVHVDARSVGQRVEKVLR